MKKPAKKTSRSRPPKLATAVRTVRTAAGKMAKRRAAARRLAKNLEEERRQLEVAHDDALKRRIRELEAEVAASRKDLARAQARVAELKKRQEPAEKWAETKWS